SESELSKVANDTGLLSSTGSTPITYPARVGRVSLTWSRSPAAARMSFQLAVDRSISACSRSSNTCVASVGCDVLSTQDQPPSRTNANATRPTACRGDAQHADTSHAAPPMLAVTGRTLIDRANSRPYPRSG